MSVFVAPPEASVVRLADVMMPAESLPWLKAERASEPEAQAALRVALAERLRLPAREVGAIRLVQRAIDARGRRARLRLTLDVTLAPTLAKQAVEQNRATWPKDDRFRPPVVTAPLSGPRPVVVGAGPAGLFAALLLAEAGALPIVVERGDPVESRGRKVSRLYAHGELDPDSNVCFGEGGAGTYSDGKLYTRVNDVRVRAVLEHLVRFGAPADILVSNRPHIGTDRLVRLLKAMRARLLALGADMRFRTRLTDLRMRDGRVQALRLNDGEELAVSSLVLATGHSARPIWHMLKRHGLALMRRPFAVGLRVEHSQELIDRARYGRGGRSPSCLPPADYRVTYQDAGGKAAYSFCMCPGGVVVTTPTESGALCINGMSHAARQGHLANSALVVTVDDEDFADAGYDGLFAGAQFQDRIEQRAYAMGGGAFVAPAARVTDFVAGRTSSSLPSTSYRRGLCAAPLHTLLPEKLTATLRAALVRFGAQLPGFVTSEATLIGVETRTASPVRLVRDKDTLQAIGARNLYPAGEGLGYGGGIVSAAVDGLRAAEALLQCEVHDGRAAYRALPVAAP